MYEKDLKTIKFDGICYATDFERHYLWKKYHYLDEYNLNYTWIQDLSGFGLTVSNNKKNPTFISLTRATVNGKEILFIDATSQVVNWRKIDKWVKRNFPNIEKSNAQNFGNLLK